MRFKPVLAAVSGNFIEWYDFGLYFFLAPILASNFFPEEAGHLALLGALSMQAISFFFRPLGAVLFGHIGDVYGRRVALQTSLFLLALLSLFMACLPNYSQAGWLAPLLLCLCRIGQGVCIGGEFAGSMVYLTESSESKKQAFWSSMSNNGSNLGVLFASISTAALSTCLGSEHFSSYGYRLLFLFGGVISLIGFSYRSDLLETMAFTEKTLLKSIPIAHLLQFEKKRVLQLFLLIGVSAIGSYGLMGAMSIFLQQSASLSLNTALSYQIAFTIFSLCLVMPLAWLADKITPRKMLRWSCLCYFVLSIPSYYFYFKYSNPLILLALVVFYSMEQASLPAFMTKLFPVEIRYSAISLAYNCSMAFIGGLAPLLSQISFSNSKQSFALAYLLTGTSLVTLYLIPVLSGIGKEKPWAKLLNQNISIESDPVDLNLV